MQVNIEKTKTLHVRAQDETTPTSRDEAIAGCNYRCPHLNCDFQFVTKRGMKIHADRCEWRDEFEVGSIAGHRGPTVARQYLANQVERLWERAWHLRSKGQRPPRTDQRLRDRKWRLCSRLEVQVRRVWPPLLISEGGCNSQIKRAQTRKTQNFVGTLADEVATLCKIVDQQASRPVIHCCQVPLDNVFREKHLGTIFTADTQQKHDVKEKIGRDLARCGKRRICHSTSI